MTKQPDTIKQQIDETLTKSFAESRQFKEDMQKLVDNPGSGFTSISISTDGVNYLPIATKDNTIHEIKSDTTIILNPNQMDTPERQPEPVDGIKLKTVTQATGKTEKFLKPLHLACADDDMRPNFKLIEIKHGIAQATNGHMVVKLELNKTSMLEQDQIDMLDGRYIHMEVWKEIHKCEMIELTDDAISCWKNGIKKTFEYGEPQGEFFNIETVIRDIKELGEIETRMIAYTPSLIAILAKIFDENSMIFSFSGANKGTIVFPSEDSGMFALLMPQMINATNRYMFLTD